MMDAKEALSMSSSDAEENLDRLTYFLDSLVEEFNYFKNRGHVNPASNMKQMMLSFLIMMLDKGQAEGLFKDMPWREVEQFFCDEDCFPENFPADET